MSNGRNADLLFSSGDVEEIEELDEILRASTNVNVQVVREAPLLRKLATLPFIDTADGSHIVGLDAIRQYLQE